MADELGNKDKMAVVVSKVPLDVKALNHAVNNAPGMYDQKLGAVIGEYLVPNINFEDGDVISFSADVKDKKAVAMVLEIYER